MGGSLAGLSHLRPSFFPLFLVKRCIFASVFALWMSEVLRSFLKATFVSNDLVFHSWWYDHF